MTRSIALVMMVRNEVATLATTIRSAVETLGTKLGAIVIVDTGSTDGTWELLERCSRRSWFPSVPADTIGIKCAASFHYGDARTEALRAAEDWLSCLGPSWHTQAIEWLFMLDAGTIVSGRPTLVNSGLEFRDGHGAWAGHTHYNVTCRVGTLEWTRPQIFRRGAGWRYEGARHEFVTGGDGSKPGASGLIVSYELKDPARPKRWESDLEALRPDAEAGEPRAQFYYAQTFECLGRIQGACAWYGRRLATTRSGFWQERYLSALRIGIYARDEGMFSVAAQIDPRRAETYVERCVMRRMIAKERGTAPTEAEWRANECDARKALTCAAPVDALFIDRPAYGWRPWDELGLAEYYLDKREASIVSWTASLKARPPSADVARIERNIVAASDTFRVRAAGDLGGILDATPEDT